MTNMQLEISKIVFQHIDLKKCFISLFIREIANKTLTECFNKSKIKKWLDENCRDKFKVYINIDHGDDANITAHVHLNFSDKNDMLLFKMTWMNT